MSKKSGSSTPTLTPSEAKERLEARQAKLEEEDLAKQEASDGVIKRCKVEYTESFGEGTERAILRKFETDFDITGAPLLEGFPSQSLTAIITIGYLAKQLGLKLVGSITSPAYPPQCIIEDLAASHSVRLLGSADLVVVQCESIIKSPELIKNMAEALLHFAERHKCRMILSVDGLPVMPSDLKDAERVRFVTTSPSFSAFMKEHNHLAVPNGAIGGFTGALLAELVVRPPPEDGDPIDMGVMLVKTDARMPGAESAVTAVKTIDAYLTNVDIDLSELEERALDLQATVSNYIAQQASTRTTAAPPNSMYM